jgi:hypothetical protein
MGGHPNFHLQLRILPAFTRLLRFDADGDGIVGEGAKASVIEHAERQNISQHVDDLGDLSSFVTFWIDIHAKINFL